MTISRTAWIVIAVSTAGLIIFATVWWLRARSLASLSALETSPTPQTTSTQQTPPRAVNTPTASPTPVDEAPLFFSPPTPDPIPGIRLAAPGTEAPTAPPPETITASSTSSDVSDTDKDGLTNDQELQLGTDSAKQDTDGDTLTDGDEVKRYRTDPLKADADGDGYTDAQEIKNGYNPVGTGKCLTTDCAF